MSTVQFCLCALHTDLERNRSNLDVQAAQQHIIQINQYFKSDITSTESEIALKTLFMDDKGILSYAKALINLDLINFKTIIADILFLFLQLIESFPISIGYYIKSIINLCDLCSITTKKCANLSIKTYQVYKKLLELNNFNDQIDVNKIIEHLNNEVSLGDKISSTARQHIYNLFGIIGQHHPMYIKNYAEKLLNLFCYELQIQINTREKNLKKFSAPIAIGCLNGLTGLLNNFADHNETHDYSLHIYEILKKLIGTVEEKKRHVINRTGLQLFQKHIQLFLKFLFQDTAEVIWFQKKLWDWCTLPNLEDKKIGLSSFEVFYKGASLEFTKNLKINEINSRNNLKKLVEIMISFLKSKMYENYLNFQEHAVVVRSIGWLSEPCYNLLGEENLIEIFIILSLQTEEKFLNSLEIKNYDPNAANYLNSLSLIIRNLKVLNSYQISFMQRLSIYCFNDFITAQPKSEWQNNIIDALIISMYCLASYHGNILDKYLKQLFYIGLAKSCSHRVASDAEIVEEYTGHILFKSTSYVPLWICLLKANQCHSFDLYLNIPITVKPILEKSLMCNFMSSFLKIITKLDLFTNKSTNEFEFETELIARKPSDFTLLINLVQVFSEILSSLELDIKTTTLWLPQVLDTIINHSIKFPIVSSLYKVSTVIFQEIDWFSLLENNKNNSIKEKILIYVNHIMVYVHVFKGDLQYCCLEMLLSLPSIIMKEIYNNKMIEILKIALKLGSTFLSLAKITVNALERWQQVLSKYEMDQLLTNIMPYLDLLLRTKGYDSEVELDNSILYQMRIHNNKKKTLIKQNKLILKPESELEIVQTKILKYLAHLDMTNCLRLLGDPNTTTNNPINVINYKLPFNDCKINISFDHLLPRILELCQYCSNRQIRFIACETFHAYIILYLGNNLNLERSKPTEMKIVTAKIIPVVIHLACDMDNLVQQLFEPLAIGIVHYFASGIQYNSIYTPIIIDILMDNVSDNNEAIKKFSAKCIKEFIHWTLKVNNEHQKPSVSLGIVIKKIEQFCIHSDPDKQLGAAITFNSCYSILREDETVINELWIQLLYNFVIILDSTKLVHSEEHVLKAIDHLHRVFMEKSSLFNEICNSRKTPNQFYGNQLFNVVEWLLKFIGSPVAVCRSKCFNMANSLSRSVKDHSSLKNVLESFVISHGENQLIKCIERDLKLLMNSMIYHQSRSSYDKSLNFGFTSKVLINWLNQLIAALDCYASLFKENMIDFKFLKSSCSNLFQSIHHFLFQIEELNFIQCFTNMNIPFEKNDKEIMIQSRNFNSLKKDVILSIFQFLNEFENNLLLDVVNQDKINELAIKCIFEYNIDYSDEKSNLNHIAVVHYAINMCCSSTFSNKLRQKLTEKWSNVVSNMNIPVLTIQNNFIGVNQLLLKHSIISSTDLLCIVDRKRILKIIFEYVYNNGVAVNFEALLLSYLEHLLDFILNLDYENDILVVLIFDTIDIFDMNTNKSMIFGQYFLNLFSKPITKYFLKIPDIFVNKLFIEYPLNDLSLNLIFEVLKTSSDEKIYDQGQLIIEKIVNNVKYWEQFQSCFSWNEIYDFVELSSNIIYTFRNENMIIFQKWICDNLTNDSLIIYYKCKLLGLLPKLVTSEIYNEPIDDNIRKSLIDFRDKYFSGASTDLRPLSIDFTNFVTVFQKILTAMEISSSNLLFEVVVEWCIKDPNHLCIKQVDNILYYFFKRLSDETQFLCCQFVYGKFRNENMSESRRLMIVNTFLIPIVSYCRKNVIIKIYTVIIDFILTTVNGNLFANDSGKARQLLVSKIACFKLIEGMFKFFTYAELNDSIIPCKLIGSQSKNLIIQFRNSAVKVRYSNVNYRNGSKEIQELLRQLHCFSYNTLVTILINTENDHSKYAIFLFNQHPPKQFIWRHLVDCSIQYEFPIDFETIPQRKRKLINIRTKCNQHLPEVYINLSSHLKNTLFEDLENYDYNNSFLRSNLEDCSSHDSQLLNQMFSVELEMDSFNNHECMAHLCAVVKSLTSENAIGSTIKPIMDLPDWMKSLKLAFCDKSSDSINSRILLLKLIINCETNFEPYAKHWLGPIMQFVLDKHLGNNLNYFLADVVSMIVSWHNIAVPSTEDEKYLAKKLLSFLLTVSHSEIKNVFKHNIELIKIVVENWKSSLEMEFDVLFSLLKPNQINKSLECGLHLIGIVTANGILPFNELNTKIFISSLIENLKSNNQLISILSSEIFGMLLKIFNDNDMDEIELLQYVSSVLKFSENMDITKVLSCLYYIHKHYSKILDSFMDDLFDIFEKLHGIHRTQCLEMVLNRLSIIYNPYEKIIKLKSFFNMLKNNGSDEQLICFKMVLQLIPSLHTKDVIVLIQIIADNSYIHSNNHRKLIYDIMCCTYEIYVRNNTDISTQILEKCKKVLLNGLLDNNDELRQQLFRFWADDKRLPLKCIDRLLILLDQLYSPDIESHFLGNLVSILLESCCTAVDFDQKIFQYPLHACEFEDYKLTVSWRAKNLATVPKYADTIASQLHQSNTLGYNESDIHQKFQIKKTLSFQFEPTLVQTQLANNISAFESYSQKSMNKVNISTLNSINEPNWNQNLDTSFTSKSDFIQQKKKRLLRDKSKLSKEFAIKNMQMNLKRDVFKKERGQKREASVTMYRKYRIGDFPDIEITNSSIIKLMIELAKRDNDIARIILSSIMLEFKNSSKLDQHYFESLNKSLTNMINHCHSSNPSLVGFIFDTAYCYPTQINLDPNKITEVATSSGLMSMGALILETSINNSLSKEINEHITKKSKMTYKFSDDVWIKLAEVYKNMGELDIVESIIQDKMNNLSCDLLKEALKAEQSNNWRTAQIKFKSLLECDESDIFLENYKNFFFEEYYKCSEYLSDWKEINKMLKSHTGENYEKIWDNNWYREQLLSRILNSELHEILSGESNGQFIEIFSNWLNDGYKEEYILTHVAAQACMIFLCCDDLNKAQLWCKLRMHNFLKEWVNISPQYNKLRADRLFNLQTISEIYDFVLCSIQTNDNTNTIKRQIQSWQSKMPTDFDSLLAWDVKMLNRSFIFNKIKATIDELPSEGKSNLKQVLNKYEVELMLNLIENAINKNNFYIAKKYLNEYRFEDIENWKSDFILCRSKILAMSSNYTIDVEKKLQYYLNSWSELDDIVEEQCSSNCLMKIHVHIAYISKNIIDVLHNVSDISLLSSNLKLEVMNKLKSNLQFGSLNEVVQQINDTIVENLKSAIHIALNNCLCTKSIINTYLILAQYCLEGINHKENNEDIKKKKLFIESVLKAMNYNEIKASELFPIILQFENLSDSRLKEVFLKESQNVPEHMFLQWINQILGCLDSSLINVISPLLIRISKVYPKALQLPLKMYMEKDVYNNEECELFLKTKLLPFISDIHLDMFIKAISNVCCPLIQLLKYINDILECMKTNCFNKVIVAFENMFNNCFITEENLKFKGKEYKTIEIYKDKLKVVLDKYRSSTSDINDSYTALQTVKKQLCSYKEEIYCKKRSTNLIHYCPWLAQYSHHVIDTLEVPGQYSGIKKPNPPNHIIITSFKPYVQVLHSKRSPIKITMIGNDGEKYSFLVKFGEDLRQDQRVEQLLQVINNTLFENSYCCERLLSLFTYTVHPISKVLGLIQWINNTVTLKDFICESFSNGKETGIKHLQSKIDDHNSWLSEKSVSPIMIDIYKQATIEYNSIVTTAKFKQLVQSIPENILRKSLLNMCYSAEMYIHLRSKFITSYSVLSICHWLLGIGDRHLNNTIVSNITGCCIGIDFDFAFHTATSVQVIPELIPFRMSPHIVSLMAPLNLTGFIRETMVHTLKTLINNKDILLSVMQVFINDPSADWIKMATTKTSKIDSDFDHEEILWFPKKKIHSCTDKMTGTNPIYILCRELESSSISYDYKNALINMLKSDSQNNIYKRSKLPKYNITPHQQVDCLLDIASDEHILGKAYSGLELWV